MGSRYILKSLNKYISSKELLILGIPKLTSNIGDAVQLTYTEMISLQERMSLTVEIIKI